MSVVTLQESRSSSERYRAAFDARWTAADPLVELRRAALERFVAAGFPTQRQEDWKYTNLRRLEARTFTPATSAAIAVGAHEQQWIAKAGIRIVLVNGHWLPALSSSDVQQPGIQPELNLRGLFTAAGDGGFWFRSVVPRYYPIPDDGPAGELLAATGRHPFRPAHLHFIVGAPGYLPVTTHVFVADSPYLDSDAVFGVKDSLVRDVPEVDDPARAAEVGLANPFRALTFDITLRRSTQPS